MTRILVFTAHVHAQYPIAKQSTVHIREVYTYALATSYHWCTCTYNRMIFKVSGHSCTLTLCLSTPTVLTAVDTFCHLRLF